MSSTDVGNISDSEPYSKEVRPWLTVVAILVLLVLVIAMFGCCCYEIRRHRRRWQQEEEERQREEDEYVENAIVHQVQQETNEEDKVRRIAMAVQESIKTQNEREETKEELLEDG